MKQQESSQKETIAKASFASPTCLKEDAARKGLIQLFPPHNFQAQDGRPESLFSHLKEWVINHNIAQKLIQKAKLKKGDYVIDYEHQGHQSHTQGPVPAAGWFSSLEWIEGKGLFAHVTWTKKAQELIKADQYRYISPVFSFDTATGEIVALEDAALVNRPGIDGMSQAQAKEHQTHPHDTLRKAFQGETPMSQTDTETALSLLKEQNAAQEEKIEHLKAQISETKEAVVALQGENETKDTIIKTLNTQLASLQSEKETQEKTALIERGIAEGKLQPTLQEWASTQTKESLEAYLKQAPTHPVFQDESDSTQAPLSQLSAQQKEEAQSLGVSEKSYLSLLQAEKDPNQAGVSVGVMGKK